MNKIKKVPSALLTLVLLVSTAGVLAAQEMPGTGLGSQSLRPYWHVFIAYTIAIVMVLGWVISIGRRLKDVEERLRK
ncbi:MAG: hypothetical protein PVJ80_02310 [Gemmatimonadota bacterium]|jgi:CcmD family protein